MYGYSYFTQRAYVGTFGEEAGVASSIKSSIQFTWRRVPYWINLEAVEVIVHLIIGQIK